MNNQEVCTYFENNIKDHKNCEGKEYIADKLLKSGYGQTCGGYLEGVDKLKREDAEPSQKTHFINYYGNDKRKYNAPSYVRLHCPQLILWIAEVAGVNIDKLQGAERIIIEFENCNDLKGNENKGGSYLGVEVERKFKEMLSFSCVNKIIKDAHDWNEVLSEVKKL